MNERWASLGSAFATLIFLWTILRQYLPYKLDDLVAKQARKLGRRFYPYIEITIPEYAGERMRRSEAYAAIESYLAASCTQHATKLKAHFAKSSGDNLLLAMDDHEEVALDFRGAKLWWYSTKTTPRQQYSMSLYPVPDERRSYRLTFHTRHRDLVLGSYLAHIVAEGKEAAARNRQRKLYTNNPASGGGHHRYGGAWSHVVFEHPATFETLAMHPDKKMDIMADLDAFRKGKEYYARIGKAWKRGYLLYGPPGTGKSTMISAIANYLEYDVYDVELTTVSTNTDLRKLLIETTGKSVVVIEDIDCSLDLTGKRKQKPKSNEHDHTEGNKENSKEEATTVTLSGLLNFIDGLWSACGGERLFVFTTNHIEKLDPALIRRGRMDKHIEMSYCTFEAFLVLASNYLGIGSHPLFQRVRELMGECRITPADVAENLMPKSLDEDVEPRLHSLIQALIRAKEEGEAKEEAMGEVS